MPWIVPLVDFYKIIIHNAINYFWLKDYEHLI